MRFTIDTRTVMHICSAVDEINKLNDAESMPASLQLLKTANKVNRLENFSVLFIPGELHTETVVEINDEVLLKYLALYVKTARLLAPLVTAAIGMWSAVQSLIKTDCEELTAFITKRKE